MSRTHNGHELKCERRRKSAYLRDVLGRLENDVGSYLQFLRFRRQASPEAVGIGFWAGLRLLLPIVEATAKTQEMSPQDFLREECEITKPYLVWEMFRHALTHSDEPRTVDIPALNKCIGWCISMNGGAHSSSDGQIHVDILRLYEQLHEFLTISVSRSDDGTLIDVPVGIVVSMLDDPESGKSNAKNVHLHAKIRDLVGAVRRVPARGV